MARLPVVGSDNGEWGAILNDYLTQSLGSDGSLKSSTVGSNQLKPLAVGEAHLAAGAVTTTHLQDGSVTLAKIDGIGQPDGIASLDTQGELTASQVPDLSAVYAPVATTVRIWQPNTAYSAGQQVISPNNDIITAIESHSSTGVYDATKWALSETFAPAGSDTLYRFRAALADRNNKPIVIGLAGSSTTYGNNATAPGFRYANLLAESIHDTYPMSTKVARHATRSLASAVAASPLAAGVHVVNAGVIGADSAAYLTATTGPQLAALNPSLVIHMVGANDFASGVSLATYRANIEARLTQLKSAIQVPCIHLLVHPYQRYDSFTPVAPWTEYGKVLASIAAADPTNVLFLDLSGRFETIGIPGTDPLGYMAADKIHLANSGHAFLAELVGEALGMTQFERPYRYSRIASDAFTGANSTDISSRALDGTYGGMAKTWTSSPASAFGITSNALVAGGTPAAAFLSVPAPPRDLEISVTVTTKPSASAGVYLDLRRESSALSGTSSSYRLLMADTTVLIIKRVSGTTTTLGTNVLYSNGDRVTLRCVGSRIDVLINGIVADSVNDTSVASGGFAGIATSGAGPHVLDDVVIDAITTF
jgi:lysophospholipase L1-like esterase